MATNDNYIGIAMGLDVSDLKSGISEANKQIQLANSEFKAASSGMEDWTKSSDGLKAKITQLSTVLTAQKSKLNGITAEYEKVAASQGENSEAARRLKIQMNNQQAIVNKTERELNNYEASLKGVEEGTIDLSTSSLRAGKSIESMADKAEKSGGKFGGLKTGLASLGKSVLGMGVALAGLATGFLATASSTREFRTDMSKLETGFTEAGLSAQDATNTYNTLYGVLGDQGKATEASAHLAQLANNQEDLSKWTDIATGVYATFGDSLPIENLTEASNETAKTGKLTGGLADALNWAGVNEEEFQAKLDACTSEQERQALITDTLNGLYGESAKKFKELNKDVIAAQEADAKLTQAMAELGKIAEPILTSLKILASDLLNAILPFVKVFGEGLQGALSGTEGAAEKMAEGLSGLIDTLLTKLTDMLPMVLDIILQLVPKIAETLLNALPQLLDVVIQLVIDVVNLLAQILPSIVAKIMEILPILINQLIAAIPQLLQAAITLLMAVVQAIPIIIVSLLEALPSIIDTIVNALVDSIPILIDAAIQLFMSILEALPVIINSLIQNMPKIIVSIVSGLIRGRAAVINGAIQLFMQIIKSIPQIIAKLPGEMGKIISGIVSGLKNGISQMFNIGKDLFNGLWDGIKSVWDNITSWASNAWNGFVNGFKNFFGIRSPSKLMQKMGGYVGEGVGIGIKDSISKVKKDIDYFNGEVVNNLNGVNSRMQAPSNASYNNSIDGSLIINTTGGVSRKEIRRLEEDHYQSLKRRLAAEGRA